MALPDADNIKIINNFNKMQSHGEKGMKWIKGHNMTSIFAGEFIIDYFYCLQKINYCHGRREFH